MTRQRAGALALTICVVALVTLYALFRHDAARGDSSLPTASNAVRTEAAIASLPAASAAIPSSTVPTGTASLPSAATPHAPERAFKLNLAELKPGVEGPILQAKEGDPIELAIASDRSGTLEVHGYNQRVALTPGAVATLAFKASHAGRFPIHLHGQSGEHLEVTALEILPR